MVSLKKSRGKEHDIHFSISCFLAFKALLGPVRCRKVNSAFPLDVPPQNLCACPPLSLEPKEEPEKAAQLLLVLKASSAWAASLTNLLDSIDQEIEVFCSKLLLG